MVKILCYGHNYISSNLVRVFSYIIRTKYNVCGYKLTAFRLIKKRWFLSSKIRDIQILYLMFALFCILISRMFSVLIRLELFEPGVQHSKYLICKYNDSKQKKYLCWVWWWLWMNAKQVLNTC